MINVLPLVTVPLLSSLPFLLFYHFRLFHHLFFLHFWSSSVVMLLISNKFRLSHIFVPFLNPSSLFLLFCPCLPYHLTYFKLYIFLWTYFPYFLSSSPVVPFFSFTLVTNFYFENSLLLIILLVIPFSSFLPFIFLFLIFSLTPMFYFPFCSSIYSILLPISEPATHSPYPHTVTSIPYALIFSAPYKVRFHYSSNQGLPSSVVLHAQCLKPT